MEELEKSNLILQDRINLDDVAFRHLQLIAMLERIAVALEKK
jgi:hypothetical protein